jgi:hypothetical protein
MTKKKTTPHLKRGRPTKYNALVCDAIHGRLSQGRSLHSICQDDDMPHEATVFEWIAKYPEFAEKYAHGKRNQMDYYAEEVTYLADGVDASADAIQKAKLQIETRKWLMGKLKPKKYGDSSKTIHVGGDVDDNPVRFAKAETALSKLTKDQLLMLNEAFESDND